MYSSVVALYGVPRSGTSWLGEIFNSSYNTVYRFQPLFSYRFKNRISIEDSKTDLEVFFEELYRENNDEFLNQIEQRRTGKYPIFKKDEENLFSLVYKECRYLYTVPFLLKEDADIKVIGIVRNPIDVLESWLNSPHGYKRKWDIYGEWKWAARKNEYRPENYFGYYKWKECIKMFADMMESYPRQFVVVRYEDLVDDTVYETKRLFQFCNISYTDQTEQFILDSKSKTNDDVYSVYREKGHKSEREMYLPEDIKEEIKRDLKSFPEAQLFNYV